MKYKNISQRAKRYARSKKKTSKNGLPIVSSDQTGLRIGFADGYRLAMKEIRTLLADASTETLGYESARNFAHDTERLK